MNFKTYLKEESSKKENTKEKIVNFLTTSKKATMSELDEFCKNNSINVDDGLNICFGLLTSFFSKGRYNEKGNSEKFDSKELKMGIQVEYEHTDDKIIAERIAKDHLTEIPGTGNNDGYYSLLERMEAGVYD